MIPALKGLKNIRSIKKRYYEIIRSKKMSEKCIRSVRKRYKNILKSDKYDNKTKVTKSFY